VNGPRFFCPPPLVVGAQVELPQQVAQHALKVLRLRRGDGMTLFDGTGGEYDARIVGVAGSQLVVELHGWLPRERESPLAVTLIQALQVGAKMDLTVQKAVELGVARIVPVVSQRSVVALAGERAARRVEHWRAIVLAACAQCGRNRVPEVALPERLDVWLARPVDGDIQRLVLSPRATCSLAMLPSPVLAQAGGRLELLVGAEGGLAPEEAQLAELAGFISVRLGPRVLRTETAGLAALAAIQFLWGDLKEETTDV